MARITAFVFLTLVASGSCLRADDEAHHEELLESETNVTGQVTGGYCCCYRPVGSKMYQDPWGTSCPLKGNKPPKSERGCAMPNKPSPCKVNANKYDVYCEWNYVMPCSTILRPHTIVWNTAWIPQYERM
eukprot:Skav236214  [mRNA]  locus=scaffold98:284980:285937:- [translate_table: standard]